MNKKIAAHSSTLFLKLAVWLIGLVVLALCIFVLPVGIATDQVGYRFILLWMYVTTPPFYFALYQALRLLQYIDKNKAFTTAAVQTLSYIKYSAATISILYTVILPYVYYIADRDDAPGGIVVGLVIIFAALAITTAAAVFQKLFQNAVTIKAENDLTV